MLPFRCVLAPVPFIPEYLATAYLYVVADLHGKGIDDVFHLATHVLEYPAYGEQDEHRGLLQHVQTLG